MPSAPALNAPPLQRSTPATDRSGRRRVFGIRSFFAPILLTPLVLWIHGYHPFADDAGIYVAGVRHILDPSLYPVNAAFPAAFTRLSIFPWILAALVRLTHLRLSWILLAAHVLSVGLFLFACRQLAVRLFYGEASRWCSTLVAAACFTLPVAGTALFIMDPYVTARSFSTPLTLFAVAAALDRAWLRATILLALAALIHPLMAAYAVAFVVVYALIACERVRAATAFCFALLVIGGAVFALTHRTPASASYREAVSLPARMFLFLARWHWYEMLGLLLPLGILGLAVRRSSAADPKRVLCLACLLLGTTSTLVAMLFVPPGGPYALVPIQVLRSFHLIYAVGLVLCGGLLAALTSRSRPAGISLVVLLFAGMFAAQNIAWPGCDRIEWPWTRPSNPYQQAFLWIRDHTPRNAVFAFNPELVYLPEEDEQGFRAIAQRDHLADDKDAGIAAVMPRLAEGWAAQRNAQLNVDRMTDAQRIAALTPLGATWFLLLPGTQTAFPCPYRNTVVAVCRLAE